MASSLRDLVPEDHALDRVRDLASLRAERDGKRIGRRKKVCLTDPDASMATNARDRRLEAAYKQHAAVDDLRGVVLDVEVTTGEANEGDHTVQRVDAADQGYACGKVHGGLERRGIDPVIPAKKEPTRSKVLLRRFRCDARHHVLKCPQGRTLRPQRRVEHGWFFYSRASGRKRCPMRARGLPAPGWVKNAVVGSDDHLLMPEGNSPEAPFASSPGGRGRC